MRNKKTARVRKKYSVLCLKQKNPQLIDACVFVSEHNIWAVVKGKQYADGRFKYIYNGREAISEPYKCIPVRGEGITRRFLKQEAIRLNIQLIQMNRPKKKLKARWAPELDPMLDPALDDLPIVEQEREPNYN